MGAAHSISSGRRSRDSTCDPGKKTVNCAIARNFKPSQVNVPSEQELQHHRPYLLRYALLQLRNPDQAEVRLAEVVENYKG